MQWLGANVDLPQTYETTAKAPRIAGSEEEREGKEEVKVKRNIVGLLCFGEETKDSEKHR